jgi:hypothetical protein
MARQRKENKDMASTAENMGINLQMNSKKGLLPIGERSSGTDYSQYFSVSIADGSNADRKMEHGRAMSAQKKPNMRGCFYGTLFCCSSGGFDDPSYPPSPCKFFNLSLLPF